MICNYKKVDESLNADNEAGKNAKFKNLRLSSNVMHICMHIRKLKHVLPNRVKYWH